MCLVMHKNWCFQSASKQAALPSGKRIQFYQGTRCGLVANRALDKSYADALNPKVAMWAGPVNKLVSMMYSP